MINRKDFERTTKIRTLIKLYEIVHQDEGRGFIVLSWDFSWSGIFALLLDKITIYVVVGGHAKMVITIINTINDTNRDFFGT